MSTRRRIGVGIAGIGFGQQVHVPAFRLDQRCEIVALCASTAARANNVAARLGVERAYGSWADMLDDPRVDAVSIATPPHVQQAIALEALRRGKAVFCEKPLAASLEAATALTVAASEAGVANMVDLWFPELPAWQAARRLLDARQIGTVCHVGYSWHVETWASRLGQRSWKALVREGGGALYSFGPHLLYNLEWLLGRIRRVWGTSFQVTRPGWSGDTGLVACAVLDTGAPVSISVSGSAPFGSGHCLEVYGEEGALVLSNPGADYASGFVLSSGSRGTEALTRVAVDGPPIQMDDGRVVSVGALATRFLDWILEGQPSAPSFADGWRVQVLLDAVETSQRTRTWVDVEDTRDAMPGQTHALAPNP